MESGDNNCAVVFSHCTNRLYETVRNTARIGYNLILILMLFSDFCTLIVKGAFLVTEVLSRFNFERRRMQRLDKLIFPKSKIHPQSFPEKKMTNY